MISKITKRKDSFFRGRLEESKILFAYRYISLLITSLFYFINDPDHYLGKRIFIIGCLTISAIILSYLYLAKERSNKSIKILLTIETIGNCMLLIPSGGLNGGINSPFVWYSLNTILISSVFLKKNILLD